jgi:rhodanese-related sulfurtransferase
MFSRIEPEKIPGYVAALAILCLAIAVLIFDAPCMEEVHAAEIEGHLENRDVHVHPVELLNLLHNDNDDLNMIVLDVRSEAEYESFHILDAHLAPTADIVTALADIEVVKGALDLTIVVVMSNDETAATEVWRALIAADIPHVFILDGGMNNWMDIFARDITKETFGVEDRGDDEAAFVFDDSNAAVASKRVATNPTLNDFVDIPYERIVNLGSGAEASAEEDAPASGGCG